MRRTSRRTRSALAAAALAALVLVLLAPLALPAQALADDVLGNSPMCTDDNPCGTTGVSWRTYSLNAYGIDQWIDLSGRMGMPKFGNLLPAAVQTISALVWHGVILVVNGVLMVLEWAFTLKLTEDGMPRLQEGLQDLHNNVLGEEWFLAAIAVAGLWGIYNGLVRLRTIQTLGGLLATVLLMSFALLIINRPQLTVGEFSQLANDSALGVIALGESGSTSDGTRKYRDASKRIFNLVVGNPWCALEFGSVGWCNGDDPTRGGDAKVRDTWLSTPAWSNERKELYEEFKDHDDVPNARMRPMEKEGAFPRIGTLGLIIVGTIGAVCLFLWLALKLVIAGVMVLMLTLAAPVMLLAPAFGESGRKAFGTWLKRLGGAIIAKLVYALFLAIVIFVANIIAGLEGLGWGGEWMILTVFWWGVLIKRKELVGFATGDQPGALGGGFGLLKAYLGYRAIRDVGGTAWRTATYLPRKAGGGLRATADYIGRRRLPKRHARDEAARTQIREDLRQQAARDAEAKRRRAKAILAREEQWRKYDRTRDRSKPYGHGAPVGKRPSEAEVAEARSVISRYGVNGNIGITDAEVERFVRESGDPVLKERYERMQKPALHRKEIRAERRRDKTEFKKHVKHETRRYRRERKFEERRRKVYR